jgi:hypothetical protein
MQGQRLGGAQRCCNKGVRVVKGVTMAIKGEFIQSICVASYPARNEQLQFSV